MTSGKVITLVLSLLVLALFSQAAVFAGNAQHPVAKGSGGRMETIYFGAG